MYSTERMSPASTPSMKSRTFRDASPATSALIDSSLMPVMMSPARRPASSAALPGVTPTIFTPSTGPSLRSSPILTPNRGRSSLMNSKRRSISRICGKRSELSSAIWRAASAIRRSASSSFLATSASRISTCSGLCAAACPASSNNAATGTSIFKVFIRCISFRA